MKDNQCQRLLDHLDAGKKIDGIKAWHQLGIYRLASRIHDLRNMGYEIQWRWVKGINKFNEKVRWKEYYL